MSVDDRLAIQELNYKYAYYIDTFQISEWAQLFTEDAYFDEREFDSDLFIGHDEIYAYGKQLVEPVRYVAHLMSNHLIFDLTPATARGVAFCLCEAMWNSGERIRFHVKYEDEYLKIDGAWKIAKRVLRKSFPPEPMPLLEAGK